MSSDLAETPLVAQPDKPEGSPTTYKRRSILTTALAVVAGAATGSAATLATRPSQESGSAQPEGAAASPEGISPAAERARRELETALNSDNVINRRPPAVVFVSATALDGDTAVRNPIQLLPGKEPVWGKIVRDAEPGLPPVISIVPFTGPLTMLSGVGLPSELRSGVMLDATDQSSPVVALVDGNAIPVGRASRPGGD